VALERYSAKALLQREAMCFVALMSSAGPVTNLRPVMMAFSKLLIKNMATRGIDVDIDQFADASVQDVGEMFCGAFHVEPGLARGVSQRPQRQLHGGDVCGPLPASIQRIQARH
jgi:hypothetical protein